MTRPLPPTLLAERFAIESELDRASTSVVLAARDRVTGARVVIKLDDDDAGRARLAREADLTARLKSERAPRVHFQSDDPPFFAMEYLEGTTLERAIDERGPLAPHDAVASVLHVLEVLAELHALGFVHRDVKPGNVMLVEGGAKLFDFGLAVAIGERAGEGGTAAFQPPEQAAGEPLSPSADVYGACATLHRALTGQFVFPPTPIGAFYEQLMNAPAPLAGVEPELDAIVAGGLEKKPADRPPLGEISRQLAVWRAGRIAHP